ncbi:MAG: molybdopterin-binding protein, partial [Pseudomonadota bacterium]
RTLLGFDFAMGYPAGFAEALTGQPDALAVWDWLAARIEDGPDNANNRFDVAAEMNGAFPGIGPLWGCPPTLTRDGLPPKGTARTGHGIASDHREVEGHARSAHSVFKLFTTGAVGSQSLVGLAALAGLRARHPALAVWPQQTGFAVPQAQQVLVEIYPSLYPPADHPIKDAGQVIATARALRAATADWFTAPATVPDAHRIAREEGWILGVLPPSSCFALPPGAQWTPVDAALDRLRSTCLPRVSTQVVPVADAAGRILADAVTATRSNPPAANSAVDGWGYAHGGLPDGPIPICPGRAAAGHPFDAKVPPGQALRILTGAEVPEGVDTIALQEDAQIQRDHLILTGRPKRGANLRPAGEDVKRGDVILPAGTRLRPPDLGLAIAAGLGTVSVNTKLRVGVLSTGDEIVPPGSEAGIPDVNRPMLLSMLDRWGLAPVDLGHAPDDAATLAAMLDGAQVDAILTSGGASAGEEDHVSQLLRRRGGVHHWRIAIKPGRPLALGHWNDAPLFGLPGNPVAAFTCAALFARPALLQMAGAGWYEPVPTSVPAAFTKRKKAGRTEVLRARLRGGQVEVFRSEGSGLVSGLSWAEGFVLLPHGPQDIRPGDPVPYVSFADLGV